MIRRWFRRRRRSLEEIREAQRLGDTWHRDYALKRLLWEAEREGGAA